MFSMFPGYGMAEDIQPSASLMETANPPLDIGEVSGNNQDDGESDVNLPGTLEDPGDIPGEDEGNSEDPGDTSGNNEGTLEDPGDIPGDNEGENLGSPIVSNAPVIPALTTYTVSYVANGTSLLEDKVVSDQAIGTVVVETAVVIEGYTPNESTKSLTLSESGNIIIFSYTVVEVPQEMPAVTLTAIVEENIVTLSADAGVLPAGATLSVRLLPEEEKLDYLSALETEQGVTLNQSMAFDITLLDEQGNEIQPNGEVTVSFSNVEFVDTNDEVLVYHFEPQEENAPKGKLASSPHKGKKIAGGFKISNKLARLYGKKVTFNTEHFSIYIVGTNIKHDNSQNRYIMNIGDTLTIEERDVDTGGTWSITPRGSSCATLAVDSSNSRKCAITAVATGNVTVRYRKSGWISNTDTFFYIQIALLDSHDTLTPAVVTLGNENAGEVTASKTAKWIDEENRIAEIEFSVKGVPLTSASDVILVMDVSGSMSDRIATAKQASNKFIDELLGDSNPANNRVAFIPFSHGSEKGGASDTEVAAATKGSLNFSYDIDLLKKHVRSTEANGGTNYTAALQKAINYAASRSVNEQSRPLNIVFMSDGAPGLSGESPNDPNWNGINQADTLRGSAYNATIYTVGIQLADGSSGVSALKNISSSDSNGEELYKSVSNMTDLEPILQTIAGQIVNAGTEAVIRDVISDKFDYYSTSPYTSDGTYNAADKSVTIDVGDITQDAKTYKIYVQLKGQYWNTNGSYPTNNSVLFTYTDIDGDPAENNDLGDPEVEVAVESYTVSFAAGANGSLTGATSFANILTGTAWADAVTVPTPVAALGYKFDSWSADFPSN
ncbi:MAG: VWA domain-containing protein, partial [Syntrophomonadaceae bacterium]|nr:VWA domain-containing protein [Syntrophomonadaceae bacterium]